MDGTLCAVSMPQFLKKYKLLFKTVIKILVNEDIMNVDFEHYR